MGDMGGITLLQVQARVVGDVLVQGIENVPVGPAQPRSPPPTTWPLALATLHSPCEDDPFLLCSRRQLRRIVELMAM
jgi:hypothetical protein